MESKQSSLRDFDVLTKLGEGAFGQVFRVRRKADGKEYALKKVKLGAMKEKERENALNQIRILASYNEQFIIGYKDAFYEEATSTLCIVMEFASGGDVLKINQTHLKARTKYKEEEIWKAMVQMTKGLKSLHQKKILHRDLKCANVFVTSDGKYKLGDLNVSKVLKKDMACTQTGTPYYASPEVWKDKPYGSKSDMWSLGCVLYEMAALKPPFTANDLSGLYKKVIAGVFERIPHVYSNDLNSVISSMLKVDPDKRPDTEALLGNSILHKNYHGEIDQQVHTEEDEQNKLLNTIRYNPKDLRGLKNFLPKSNYITEEKEDRKEKEDKKDKQKTERKESMKELPIPSKESQEDRKIQDFLKKRKELEEKERLRMLHLKGQEQSSDNKQRVLSACGIRSPKSCLSPKIAVHKKTEDTPSGINSCKPPRKDQHTNNNTPSRMPPRPPGAPVNYRLPPRQSKLVVPEQNQREKSRQNLRNAGIQIVNPAVNPVRNSRQSQRETPRSSSASKPVYPSWWG